MRETTTETAIEQATEPRPRLGSRIKTWFSRLRIGPRAWTGAAIGALLAGTVATWVELDAPIGFGSRADRGLEIGVAVIVVALCTAMALLVAWLVRFVPLKVIAAFAGGFAALVVIPLVLEGQVFVPLVLIIGEIIPLEMLFGLSLGAILGGELFGASRTVKIGMGMLFALTLAANVYLVILLSGRGSDSHLVAFQSPPPNRSLSHASDPGERGHFAVKKLVYGSGDATRRPEFGVAVDLRSEPVDATRLLPFLKGFRNAAREWFWGFDPQRLPINGTVWTPEGAGPFPLVLIVHGNHDMEEFSDPGYVVPRRASGQPRFHYGLGRREFLERHVVGRHARKGAAGPCVDPARASQAVEDLELEVWQSFLLPRSTSAKSRSSGTRAEERRPPLPPASIACRAIPKTAVWSSISALGFAGSSPLLLPTAFTSRRATRCTWKMSTTSSFKERTMPTS